MNKDNTMFRFRKKTNRHWATTMVEHLLILQIGVEVDGEIVWTDATTDDIENFDMQPAADTIEVVIG